jgi:hypothetical protein
MSEPRHKKADEAILLALACGASVESAARQGRTSVRTVYRRLEDPAFRRRLLRLRGDLVQRTAGTLTAAGTEAVRVLLELLKSSVPAGVRLQAAKAVIEGGIKVREATEFEERLVALEEEAESRKDR